MFQPFPSNAAGGRLRSRGAVPRFKKKVRSIRLAANKNVEKPTDVAEKTEKVSCKEAAALRPPAQLAVEQTTNNGGRIVPRKGRKARKDAKMAAQLGKAHHL